MEVLKMKDEIKEKPSPKKVKYQELANVNNINELKNWLKKWC